MAVKFNSDDFKIINCAFKPEKPNILLTGGAGSGKTTLVREITSRSTSKGIETATTSTTGISALQFSGGTTFHNFAGIGNGDMPLEDLIKNVMRNPKKVKKIRDTAFLVIDEISMMGASLFDKCNKIMKKVRMNDKPFGGIQLLLSGDFLQLPPVNDGWVFESQCWSELNLQIFNLVIPKRYDDVVFHGLLSRIRIGEQTLQDMEILKTRMSSIEAFENSEIKPTLLFSKKMDVEYINNMKLATLKHPHFQFAASDNFTPNNFNSDGLKKLLSDQIPDVVNLCIGAQVILKYNLDVKAGLVNGSRGVVVCIEKESDKVFVKFRNGIIMPITRYTWELRSPEYVATRSQIPLILGWALTVHKAQGSTLDFVLCDLGNSIFSPAQSYVALSRVRNLNSLFISDLAETSFQVDQKALAFVKGLPSISSVGVPVPTSASTPTSTITPVSDSVSTSDTAISKSDTAVAHVLETTTFPSDTVLETSSTFTTKNL